MSYDVSLYAMREVAVFERNMTSNVSALWAKALEAVTGLKTNWDSTEGALEILARLGELRGDACLKAATHIREHLAEYEPLVKGGGQWGTAEHAIGFLVNLGNALIADPDARLWVSR